METLVSVFMQMLAFLLANHQVLAQDKSSTDWFEICSVRILIM